MVGHVTEQTFEQEVLQHKGYVLVDFWAEWCGPCKQLLPVLEAITQQVSTLHIVKLNVDESPEIARRYGVRSIPTLILFKEGKQIDIRVGALPQPALLQWIQDTMVDG